MRSPVLFAVGLAAVSAVVRPAAAGPAVAGPAADAPRAQAVRVVIVSMRGCCADEAWPEAEAAARAELLGSGIGVEVVESLAVGERERRLELRTVAAERRADSALRIVRPPEERATGGVEVWLEDRVTERTMVRRLRVAQHTGEEGALVAALKALEAVRATVMELALARDPAGPPRVAEAATPAAESPVHLRVGGGVVGGPGDMGALGALTVSVRADLGALPLALEAEGLVSVGGASVSSGDATCDVALVRGWAWWAPRRGSRLRPALGVGAGVALPWASGTAGAPSSDRAAVAYLGAGAELGVRLTRRLAVRGGANVGVLLPQVRILVGDEVAARLGRPLVEGLLALEVQIR